MEISPSAEASLNGLILKQFNAWEAAFIQAVTPPAVIVSLFNTPDNPH